MPSITPAPTSRSSASSSPCIHGAQRSTSSASSPMTSETPEPGLPTCGAPGLLCRIPGPHFTRHDLRPSIAATRKGPNSKIYRLGPFALSKCRCGHQIPLTKKSMKALKVTPLRNGCCVVTTGTAKTSLAAVRAQTDHPLDQPALAEGVFIFDLFGLCCGLCVAIPSICCLQNSSSRIFLFQNQMQ